VQITIIVGLTAAFAVVARDLERYCSIVNKIYLRCERYDTLLQSVKAIEHGSAVLGHHIFRLPPIALSNSVRLKLKPSILEFTSLKDLIASR